MAPLPGVGPVGDLLVRMVVGPLLNVYSYGIDLAEKLNYTGITVLHTTDAVRLKTLRMLRDEPGHPLNYVVIEGVLMGLFQKYPPGPITIDYTYEKSVAERIEAKFHPGFANPYADDFNKWQKVEPITFSKNSKLALKNNAAFFLQNGLMRWPAPGSGAKPEVEALIKELKDQMMREAGKPSAGVDPVLVFPKPHGHDNDLIISLELNLYGLRQLIPQLMAGGVPSVAAAGVSADSDYWEEMRSRREKRAEELAPLIRKALAPGSEITDITIDGESENTF